MAAFLFDFNGVLVDDERVHFAAFREVLGRHGVALDEKTYVERYLAFDDATAFGIGYDHPLSKRTSVYARYLYLKNGGDASNTVIAGVQPQPGGTEQVLALGITHRF